MVRLVIDSKALHTILEKNLILEVKKMMIKSVKHAVYEDLTGYLERNQNIDRKQLLANGYIAEIDGKIEASFILDKLDSDALWLKQLYITQAEAAKLPILLETILQLARKQEAKIVFVHSHQPVVDILLEALQFKIENNQSAVPLKPVMTGNWWSYHVS